MPDKFPFKLVRNETANPAAGSDASITPPGPYGSILECISFTIACDANVSNRLITIEHNDGTNSRIIGPTPTVAVAGTTVKFCFSTNAAFVVATNNPTGHGALPDNVEFLNTDTLELVVTNIQVGDQLSLITHWWRVFL